MANVKNQENQEKKVVYPLSPRKKDFPTPMRQYLRPTIGSPSKNPFPEVNYSISDINKKQFSPGSRIDLDIDPSVVDDKYDEKQAFMKKYSDEVRAALAKKGKKYTPERKRKVERSSLRKIPFPSLSGLKGGRKTRRRR
jgi:hypothetical protein